MDVRVKRLEVRIQTVYIEEMRKELNKIKEVIGLVGNRICKFVYTYNKKTKGLKQTILEYFQFA